MSPLILVGLVGLPRVQEKWFNKKPKTWVAALCACIAINSLSTPLYVLWSARIGHDTPRNYVRQTDLDAIGWLKENTRDTDIILSNDVIGGRIAFYVNARVALGHWALTPQIKSLKKRFSRFAAGELSNRKASRFIAEIKPRYIYFSNRAKSGHFRYIRRNPDVLLVYSNDDVAIYELNAQHAIDFSPEPDSRRS